MKRCSNCGGLPRPGGTECHPCARYRQRVGEPRPYSLVVRTAQRRFEAYHERRIAQGFAG